MAGSTDDEDARLGLGLFLFAHLRLAADADEQLASLGLNRTHHRILYLATRAPGTIVGEFARVLRLTPQAIQAPMRRLIRDGLIEQRSPEGDRRRREVYVTVAGETLQRSVAARQYDRLKRAFQPSAPVDRAAFFRIMTAILDDEDATLLRTLDADPKHPS